MKKDELLEAKKAAEAIRTLIDLKKIDDAKYQLDLLLKKYPEFPSLMLQFGNLKMATGSIEEAREILNKLRETYEGESAILQSAFFESNFGLIEKAREYFNMLTGTPYEYIALKELIYLDIREEKYEDAYKKANCDKVKSLNPNLYTFIIQRLGILDHTWKISRRDYFVKQITNYSQKAALGHILTHVSKSKRKTIHSVFDPSVDVVELFFNVKEQLKPENVIRATEVDIYKLYYQDVGEDKSGKKANYCQAVTIHGESKNILTMYPYNLENGYGENFSCNGNATIGEEFKVVAMPRLN